MKSTGCLAMLVVILVIGASSVESARSKLCGENPRMSRSIRRFIPNYHNIVRAKEQAAAMMKLVWSQELARRAREQAVKCEFKNSILTDCSGRPLSQSLYLEAGALPGSVRVNWPRVVRGWYRHGRYYNHTTGICKPNENCGQYKMMVQDHLRWVGCSYARCPIITVGVKGKWTNAVIYVCNYRSTGRYTSSNKPYVIGQPCSDCASLVNKGYVCNDNLCDECIWKKNHNCTCVPKKCSKTGGFYSQKVCRCVCKKGFWGDLCDYPCACKNMLQYCNFLPKSFCSRPEYNNWFRKHCAAACPKVCTVLKPPANARC